MSTLRVYDDLVQLTPEWFEVRRGIVTASVVKQIVTVGAPDALAIGCSNCEAEAGDPCVSRARKEPTPIKGIHDERLAAAKDLPPTYVPTISEALVHFLAAERVSGHVEETFPTRDMERGILAEPYARDLYSKHYAPASEAGFMVRDFGDYALGYSPDGVVGDDGLIEIKAPKQKGHLTTVVSDEVPSDHMAQCQAGLLVSGREWCDYVPYHGGLPLWRKRVTPDPAWQTAIHTAVAQVEDAITEVVAKYKAAVEGLPATKRIDFNVVELKGIA